MVFGFCLILSHTNHVLNDETSCSKDPNMNSFPETVTCFCDYIVTVTISKVFFFFFPNWHSLQN